MYCTVCTLYGSVTIIFYHNTNLSGGLGIQSVASLVFRVAPPSTTSFCISESFCSRSITFFCSRMTDVHFFSSKPEYFELEPGSLWRRKVTMTRTSDIRDNTFYELVTPPPKPPIFLHEHGFNHYNSIIGMILGQQNSIHVLCPRLTTSASFLKHATVSL